MSAVNGPGAAVGCGVLALVLLVGGAVLEEPVGGVPSESARLEHQRPEGQR